MAGGHEYTVQDKYDLLITDLKMPQAGSLNAQISREMNPDHVIIVITGYGTVNTAGDAMRLGRSIIL